jgi:hypothetical protein
MTDEEYPKAPDVEEDFAEQEKPPTSITPPEAADVAKHIEYLGNKNLKQELEALKEDIFDNFNCEERVNRYAHGLLVHLDTAIRNEFDRIKEVMGSLGKVLKHPEVANRNWDDNIWYQIYLKQKDIIEAMSIISSYKAWQVSIMTALLDKLRGIIITFKGPAAETQTAQLIKDTMNEFVNYQKSMREEERIRNSEMIGSIQQHSQNLMSQMQHFYETRITHLMRDKGVPQASLPPIPTAPAPQRTEPDNGGSALDILKQTVQKAGIDKGALTEGSLEETILNYVKKNPGAKRPGVAKGLSYKGHNQENTYKTIEILISKGELKERDLGHKQNKNELYLPGDYPDNKSIEMGKEREAPR